MSDSRSLSQTLQNPLDTRPALLERKLAQVVIQAALVVSAADAPSTESVQASGDGHSRKRRFHQGVKHQLDLLLTNCIRCELQHNIEANAEQER